MSDGLERARDRARAIIGAFRAARGDDVTLAQQVRAILNVNGFIRFDVTDAGQVVAVTLASGQYQTDRHRSRTLAQMSNRLSGYGLMTEDCDGGLHVARRGTSREWRADRCR